MLECEYVRHSGGLLMVTRLIFIVLPLAILAGSLGSTARAAQLGPYVGGSYGITERDFGIEPFDDFFLNGFFPGTGFIVESHSSSLDTKDRGYMALIGYRLTAHLAIEGMFVDLGEMTYRAATVGSFDDSDPFALDTKLVGKLSGIGLHVLGIWPINYRWEIYARGGVQFTSPKLGGRIDNVPLDFRPDSATDLVGGVGIAMSMLEVYGLRLEYMRVFDAGESGTAESDTDFLSLGFIVAF